MLRFLQVLLALFVVFSFLSQSCKKETADADAGIEALKSWAELPVLHDHEYYQFSSYDRERKLDYPFAGPKNKDFNNFLAVCGNRADLIYMEQDDPSLCDEGIEGYLLAKVDSKSGYVSRIWTTALGGFNDATLKIYADNLTSPVYTTQISDWEFDKDPIFKSPLSGSHSGSLSSYIPISFKNSLRILLDNVPEVNTYYYHIDIQHIDSKTSTFDPENYKEENLKEIAALFTDYSNQEISDEPAFLVDNLILKRTIESKIFEINQPGTIIKLAFTFNNISLSQLRNIYLKIKWDFLTEYSVNLPFSAFFGCHQNISEFTTLPLKVIKSGDSLVLYSFFPMPFQNNAQIYLENLNDEDLTTTANLILSPDLPENPWGYFHAIYNEVISPVPDGALYPVAKISGKGKYIGTFMFMEGHRDDASAISHPLNFLEGDEIGIIDGVLKIHGTGTEDYFNGGFYFLTGEYNYAFSGVNYRWFDDYSGRVSAYRWHILTDEINFSESFELTFEYGPDKPEIADRYASVGYFYLAGD